jgi:hypothetical protein
VIRTGSTVSTGSTGSVAHRRSLVGRLSFACRSIAGRLSFACRLLVVCLSVACRLLVVRFVLKLYMPVLIFKGRNQFLEYKDYFTTHYT